MTLYKPLHAYMRNKLKLLYPNNEFPKSGHIPAHILGNIHAQELIALIDEETIIPYPGRAKLDITDALKAKVKALNLVKHSVAKVCWSLLFNYFSQPWIVLKCNVICNRIIQCGSSTKVQRLSSCQWVLRRYHKISGKIQFLKNQRTDRCSVMGLHGILVMVKITGTYHTTIWLYSITEWHLFNNADNVWWVYISFQHSVVAFTCENKLDLCTNVSNDTKMYSLEQSRILSLLKHRSDSV